MSKQESYITYLGSVWLALLAPIWLANYPELRIDYMLKIQDILAKRNNPKTTSNKKTFKKIKSDLLTQPILYEFFYILFTLGKHITNPTNTS